MDEQLKLLYELAKKKSDISEWIKEKFKDEWQDIETDINFSDYEPESIAHTFHITEEIYKIDGNTYRLLYTDESESCCIQKLKDKND